MSIAARRDCAGCTDHLQQALRTGTLGWTVNAAGMTSVPRRVGGDYCFWAPTLATVYRNAVDNQARGTSFAAIFATGGPTDTSAEQFDPRDDNFCATACFTTIPDAAAKRRVWPNAEPDVLTQ